MYQNKTKILRETLSASRGITLSSNQLLTFPTTKTSNIPCNNYQNLFDQSTFPHQPSCSLANSQNHTKATIYHYTGKPLIRKLPNNKLDTLNSNPPIWTDWIQLFVEFSIDLRPLTTTEKRTPVITSQCISKELSKKLPMQWTMLSLSLSRPQEKYGKVSVIGNA